MKQCITCKRELSLDSFYKNRSRTSGHNPVCKMCHRLYQRKWVYKNRYGISYEEYVALFNLQNGTCPLCNNKFSILPDEGFKGLVVDHNHETGEVRGLLCNPCNSGLGLLGDSPEVLRSAIEYLEKNGFYG